MRTRTATVEVPRIVTTPHHIRTRMGAVHRTRTAKVQVIPAPTAPVRRTPMAGGQLIRTPTVEPRLEPTGKGRSIQPLMERRPTHLLIIHRPPTMGTIRPPRRATTEQLATTAAPAQPRGLR